LKVMPGIIVNSHSNTTPATEFVIPSTPCWVKSFHSKHLA
jgi:hypothetical protein